MSFIYDIQKQLVQIGAEFENKFIKSAQQPAPPDPSRLVPKADPQSLVPIAVKYLDRLQSSMKDIYPKDLTNLRAFINYCLDKKVELDGERLVYRFEESTNNFGSMAGAEFANLSDELKSKYTQYENAYMVNKTELVKKLDQMVQQTESNGNRVATVLLSKLIAEANQTLQLGMKKTPKTEAAGGGDMPEEHPEAQTGTGQANRQGDGQNAQSGNSGTPAKGEMADAIKSALSGAVPLSNVLDLIIIKRFFEVLRDWANKPENKERFDAMLSKSIGAAKDSPLIEQKRQNIASQGNDGIRYADQLLGLFAKTRIQPQDIAGSAGRTNVDTFAGNVMRDNLNTASHVANAANVLIYLINRVSALVEECVPNDEFSTQQNQVAQGWLRELGKLQNSAQIVSRSDQAKLK